LGRRNTYTEALILNADVVMKSPGILKSGTVKKHGKKGIPVLSEIELAAPFMHHWYY
jgi:UDP-N-acetylmuramoylalanine--D-glutamate ligase